MTETLKMCRTGKTGCIIFLCFSLLFALSAQEVVSERYQRPDDVQLQRQGEKVQKVVFKQDDAQHNMVTKIFLLKHTKASDLFYFIESAIKRFDVVSTSSPISDNANNRQILIVTTGQDMMPYVTAMIQVLDRPAKINEFDSIVNGTGIAYGVYRPRFRAAAVMRDIIRDVCVYSGAENARIELDEKTNTFYFKDTPARAQNIKNKLAVLDQEIPQASIELKVYEVRDSDLKDIGIDYLAWKNGPGLNLFEAGYDALSMNVSETIIQQLAERGIDLMGNFSYGFGGFYTAPAFDFSFVRILEQNGKAIINSTAQVTVSNDPSAQFRVNFSPEYQNVLKDKDHISQVSVGGDATLTVVFSNTVITGGENGVVNFSYDLKGSNVVERNNLGTEISENTSIVASSTLQCKQERIIANWSKTSEVEQTIGIPFLCELPILKYIFGTTTSNTEVVHYFLTARAVPLKIQKNMTPGIMVEFDSLLKKTGQKAADKEEKK